MEIDEDEEVRPKKNSNDEDDVGDSSLGVVEDPEDSPVSAALCEAGPAVARSHPRRRLLCCIWRPLHTAVYSTLALALCFIGRGSAFCVVMAACAALRHVIGRGTCSVGCRAAQPLTC